MQVNRAKPAVSRAQIVQRRQSTPIMKREVRMIKKDRKKKNIEQMLVVYFGDKNDNGHWVDVSNLTCTKLIEEYRENKKKNQENSKNEIKKSGNRTIKEIKGMIPSDEHKYIYVVHFNDSNDDEYITWKDMHNYYSKYLLKFYEAHIDQSVLMPQNNHQQSSDPSVLKTNTKTQQSQTKCSKQDDDKK